MMAVLSLEILSVGASLPAIVAVVFLSKVSSTVSSFEFLTESVLFVVAVNVVPAMIVESFVGLFSLKIVIFWATMVSVWPFSSG